MDKFESEMIEKEFRVLIKHCFLMGKTAEQAQQWLEKNYKQTPSKEIICWWYNEFKCGRMSTGGASR